MGQVSITELTTGQTGVTATQFNNLVVPLLNEFNTSIDNTNIKSSAAIAYSKLNLGEGIVNSDISASAAIDYSKLGTLTSGNIIVGNASNLGASVTMSGDATISNTGALTIANDAVETAMLADDAVTGPKLAGVVTVNHDSAVDEVTTTSTSFGDLDDISITFTPEHASNPIMVWFSCVVDNSTAGNTVTAILDIGGNIAETERTARSDSTSTDKYQCLAFQYYTTLSASSKTVKVQWKVNGGTGYCKFRALTVQDIKQN